MALQLFSNSAQTFLAAPLSADGTTMTVATGTGTLFKSPTGGDYELATLSDGNGANEVVKINYINGGITDRGFAIGAGTRRFYHAHQDLAGVGAVAPRRFGDDIPEGAGGRLGRRDKGSVLRTELSTRTAGAYPIPTGLSARYQSK